MLFFWVCQTQEYRRRSFTTRVNLPVLPRQIPLPCLSINGRISRRRSAWKPDVSRIPDRRFFSSIIIVRLYVNGTLSGYTNARTFYTSGSPTYLFLGLHSYSTQYCQRGPAASRQLYGVVDEFRVFNRALTQSDICALANV